MRVCHAVSRRVLFININEPTVRKHREKWVRAGREDESKKVSNYTSLDNRNMLHFLEKSDNSISGLNLSLTFSKSNIFIWMFMFTV